MPRWINVPNLFTACRLALAPFIILAILGGSHTLALALFVAAAFTDVLDGAAARRFGLTTDTGAYLDPVADKCLLSGVFLALAVARILPWWFVAIVFGRDLYLLAAVSLVMLSTGVRKFPPSIWGKASTFFQISTAVVWMARNMLGSPVLVAISTAILWPSAALTIWSGVDYTRRGIRAFARIDGVSARE
jgi:cardiolipin synthase